MKFTGQSPQSRAFIAFLVFSGLESLVAIAVLWWVVPRLSPVDIPRSAPSSLLLAGFHLLVGMAMLASGAWVLGGHADRLTNIFNRLSSSNAAFFVCLAAALVSVYLLGASSELLPPLRLYWDRLRPLAAWVALVSAQAASLLGLADMPLPLPAWRRSKVEIILTSLAYLIYTGWLVYLLLQNPNIYTGGDTHDYLHIAGIPLSQPWAFVTSLRPWSVPLLYKLVGGQPQAISVLQTLLHILGWGSLAWYAGANLPRPGLRFLTTTLLLAFSLSPQIALWTRVILSESITLSLLALWLAAWFALLHRPDWRTCTAVMLVGWLWLNARETNLYLGLMLAGVLLLVMVLFKRWRFLALLAVLTLLAVQLSMYTSGINNRWRFPLANLIAQRILPFPERIGYFEKQHDMPVNPALLSLAGEWGHSQDYAFLNSPELREFQDWLDESGKSAYLSYLLENPLETALAPVAHSGVLFNADLDKYAPGLAPALPAFLLFLIYPTQGFGIFMLLGGVGLAVWLRAVPWRSPAYWSVPVIMLLMVYPHMGLVWHGDAMAVPRHAIQVSVQLRLAVWLLLLFAVSKLSESAAPAQKSAA